MQIQKTVPKRIVIIGGGTAGWMTASLLEKAWGEFGTEILLIESAEVNKIGVGEGSTPALKLFFKHLDIAENEWMPACNATYKCGIEFPNWVTSDQHNKVSSSYIHPFYSQADQKTGNAFIYNANLRRKGIDVPAHPDDYWLQSTLVKQNKCPIAKALLRDEMDYGYHFDSALVGEFLKQRMLAKGIKHYIDTVIDVTLNSQGEINEVITKEHGAQHADLFVDCSGFAALLIRKALNVNFIDYKSSLYNDKAIAIQSTIDTKEPIPSKTVSTALSAGWAWRIPLSNRYGNGYVYSSKYISDKDAEKELREHIGDSCNGFNARVINMRLGRIDKHWHKNVLAVGLSQGFIEPLEATAIMLIQHTTESFINDYELMLNQTSPLSKAQAEYNTKLNDVFENIKDYIVAHYRLNARTDTQYWRDNRNNPNNSTRLTAILKAWQQKDKDFEQVLLDHNAELTYFSPSWYCLFAGKSFFTETLIPLDETIKSAPTEEIKKYCQKVSEHFIDHQTYLKQLYGQTWQD